MSSVFIEAVTPPHRTRDFELFTAKDAEMARKADFGLMLWDGQSTGTLVNIARLVASSKPAVLYLTPQRRFLTLKTRSGLISEYAPEFMQASILETG